MADLSSWGDLVALNGNSSGTQHADQLAEWTRPGFLTRTSTGTYALATPP